ncbi:MAG TPA: FAD-dependent oxidoreductase [Verrucomicrobiales bacterium]|nr:FAD-dependent oxidoreductase [Verrucomicrobiales bacterium]
MKTDFEIAVIGSGFAGSVMAMIARRLGRSVVLLEKGRHPRFVIGESSTPLANLLLEELARTYDLPQLLPFTKWGTWQREHPELAAGLKRGFTFHHHRFDEPYEVDALRHRQLLVAASPHDEIADTHWFRADLDAWLVRQAQLLGVDYRDGCSVRAMEIKESGACLTVERDGGSAEVRVRFVIDASGPRGCLHRLLGLEETPLPEFPGTQTQYSHFIEVRRFGSELEPKHEGSRKSQGAKWALMRTDPWDVPPYPPDDAAVHHVFPGGWMWMLRFNNGITSAGVSVTDALADDLKLGEGEAAWRRLLARLPSVADLFRDARPVRPFVHQSRVAFRSRQIVGQCWVLLPSAAGFVDPLLSTGFPLTLLGVKRLAAIVADAWNTESLHARLAGYARTTDDELLVAAELIGGLLKSLDRPVAFNALTQLYFAAASFSESAIRLGHPELAEGFLLHQRGGFREGLRRCIALAAAGDEKELSDEVTRLIAPINVAGLADPAKRNWYSCHAEDLLRNAAKVNSTRDEVAAMLERIGFHDQEPVR